MRSKNVWAILILLLVVGAVLFGWSQIRRGFSARAMPSRVEMMAARGARRLAIPSSYKTMRNPFPSTPEYIQAGMEHFADHCAVCHGNDGSGDTMFGKNMYPKPPDFRQTETQKKTDGELYYTIENGVRLSGMPAFGEEHEADTSETWHLVTFIRHLSQLTAEEKKDMERFNPKSEMERMENEQEQKFLHGDKPSGMAMPGMKGMQKHP